MIGLALGLIFALMFGILCYASKDESPRACIVLFFLTFICALTGAGIYPMSEEIQAKQRLIIDQHRIVLETSRADMMISKLGSPEAYIKYIDALN